LQEKALPALEAAHIRPYGDGGGHQHSSWPGSSAKRSFAYVPAIHVFLAAAL
jgi:hypothetical protein